MILKLLKNIRDRHNFKRRLKKADVVISNVPFLGLNKEQIERAKRKEKIYNDLKAILDERFPTAPNKKPPFKPSEPFL